MQKITFIKNYNNHRIGDTAVVTNNVAHGFIDNGVAVLSKFSETRMMKAPIDRMMRAEARIERKKRREERRVEKIKKRQPYRIK